jgi:hypothetical protein
MWTLQGGTQLTYRGLVLIVGFHMLMFLFCIGGTKYIPFSISLALIRTVFLDVHVTSTKMGFLLETNVERSKVSLDKVPWNNNLDFPETFSHCSTLSA